MKLLVLALSLVAVLGTCPLNRPLKIAMYPFIPDLALDGWAGLKDKLEADFYTATGCSANLVFTYNINTYNPPTVVQALRPCAMVDPVEPCGFDLAEIDTVTLDNLVQTPDLIREMPTAVQDTLHDFFPQARKMVKIDGVQYAQPSYSCDNLFFTYENDLDDISNRRDLLDWLDGKVAGNSSRQGYTTDLWAIYDLTTIYVDAFIDSHPTKKKLCCGAGTAYGPQVKASVARGLNDLASTCYDHKLNKNPCLDGTYYNDPNLWFTQLITHRAVLLQGFSSYISNIKDLGGDVSNLHVSTAILGSGSQSYLFTDAFVLGHDMCTSGTGCIDAAALWMNWQRLDGQAIINLGLDLDPQRPRFLVSSNKKFYRTDKNPAIAPYKTTYDNFYNEDGDGTLNLARPLDVEHFTDHICDLYDNIAAYVPTNSNCALQNKANQ